jgi:hypothetical protein
VPTLRDLFSNAKFPENLKVCIAWQRDENDSLEEFENHPQVQLIRIPYKESKGACWARNLIQQKYFGETYTLQLDSHHRFIKNWDEEIVIMYQGLINKGVKKPLLTSYIPSYSPANDPLGRIQVPWKMNFDRFIPEGAIFFLPATIENYKDLTEPVPSRFYSAHFCFTTGKFCIEVPHDPEYYFHGEEISIAVRAYTHGYDLYHPHKVIAWHEYTRNGRTKHWDDHNTWGEINSTSHLRNRKLFGMDGLVNDINFGVYGFGTERTLREYEEYAGISFAKRAIQKPTKDNALPPNPRVSPADWDSSFLKIFKHCIDIPKSSLPEKDYDFWCVAYKDDNDRELYRKDAEKREITMQLNSPDKWCKIWREFQTEAQPAKWVVWPYSKEKGWCSTIEGNL